MKTSEANSANGVTPYQPSATPQGKRPPKSMGAKPGPLGDTQQRSAARRGLQPPVGRTGTADTWTRGAAMATGAVASWQPQPRGD